MADQFPDITKTGICDGCGQDKALNATPHAQANNPKLWWYCDICQFAHNVEKSVQAKLRILASRDPNAAEDPTVVGQLHEESASQILVKKAQEEKLSPNETIIEGEVVPQ